MEEIITDKTKKLSEKERVELAERHGYARVGKIIDELGFIRVKKGTKHFHVRPDGTPAYEVKFFWVGNFCEENRSSPVRDNKGLLHIRPDGTPLYEERFDAFFDSFTTGAKIKDGILCYYQIDPKSGIVEPIISKIIAKAGNSQ